MGMVRSGECLSAFFFQYLLANFFVSMFGELRGVILFGGGGSRNGTWREEKDDWHRSGILCEVDEDLEDLRARNLLERSGNHPDAIRPLNLSHVR